MDKKDREILKILAKDARISYQELGNQLGISRVAALKRVRKLEREGIIRGYNTAIFREDEITLLIDIVTTPEAFDDVLEYVSTRTAFVRQIFKTTKENHIHLVAVSDNIPDLNYLTKMIQKKCGDKIEHFQYHAIREVVKDVYLRIDARKKKEKGVLSMKGSMELLSEKIRNPEFLEWAGERDATFRFPVYQGKIYMDAGIEELELSVRSSNCLRQAGYDTVGSVVDAISGRSDLLKIRNMGKRSADEVMLKLFLFTYGNLEASKKKGYLTRVMEMN